MSSSQANNQQPEGSVQQQVSPGSGCYTNKIHFLRVAVLDVLKRKKFAFGFMQPVDITKKPQYYNFVRRPIDVDTIKKRVMNLYYHNANEMICDLELMVKNNKMYYMLKNKRKYRNCLRLQKFLALTLLRMPEGDERVYHGKPPSSDDDSSTGSDSEEE